MQYVSMRLRAHDRVSSTVSRPKILHGLSSFRQYTLTKQGTTRPLIQPPRLVLTKIKVPSPNLEMKHPEAKKRNATGVTPLSISCGTVPFPFQDAITVIKTVTDWISAGLSTGSPSTLYPALVRTGGPQGTSIAASPSLGAIRTIAASRARFPDLSMEN